MTSGPSCVMALSKEGNTEDLFNEWRKDVGSSNLEEAKKNLDSLRAQYATDKVVDAIHGSDSHESSLKFIIKLDFYNLKINK
jgi:nucleoside diphosphate kinase